MIVWQVSVKLFPIRVKGIKNIVFDLGGVLYDIDYQRTIKSFESLGIKDAPKLYSQAQQSQLFDHYEKGLIKTEEFIDSLQDMIHFEVSQEKIIDAWNALLLGIDVHKLTFLEEVGKIYRIFLLSNTNEMHINRVHGDLEQYGYESFAPLFEKVYYSFQIGMRKPDAEIFKKTLEDNDLIAEETLFIDDSIQHIQGAQKLGIQTHHHTEGDITEWFSKKS